MPLVLSNRVQETGTANTTVSFTLAGAVQGFQTFAAIGNGNTTYYSATDGAGNWEVGLGTYSTTGPTLTRTTVYASSNAGAAVTFSGAINVFVTYPSGKSVNLDASGNVSALGNVASGTWQGSTVGVAYGGTGVTSSTGPNSVVLRDGDGNVKGVNNVEVGITFTTSAGGITTMTAASTQIQSLNGTANQTYKLPNATTLQAGTFYTFGNSSSGVLTVTDNANAVIETITTGGAAQVLCISAATVAGTWSYRVFASSNTTWGNDVLDYPGKITNAEWNGDTLVAAYGGTGLTTFTGANNALYSTGASTLTAGTLPVLAGGTGVTTSTGSGDVVLSTSPTLVTPALGTPASGNLANCTFPTLNQNTTGTAANVTGIVAFANGGTGQTNQQDAMDALAGAVTSGQYLRGNGTDVVMSAIQVADVPTLNQNTTGTAANVTGTVAVANGGTGQTTYTDGQLLIGSSTGNTLTKAALSAGTGISITNGSGTITIASTVSGGVTSVTGTAPVNSSGGTTPDISLAANYGDTQNPYASKTANNFLAAPNGTAGVPTFRAVVAADIPTLNQNTTGAAGSVANTATFNNGGSGDASGTTYNGSAARTISYNTLGAPSVTGTGASGSWGIDVTGNAATATTATNVSGGTVSATTGSFSGQLTVNNVAYFNAGTGAFDFNDVNLGGAGGWASNEAHGVNTYYGSLASPNIFTRVDSLFDGTKAIMRWKNFYFSGPQTSTVMTLTATSATTATLDVLGNITLSGSQVLTAGNYNTYAPTLTGTGASGTWGINITGNAATATSAPSYLPLAGGTMTGALGLPYAGYLMGSNAFEKLLTASFPDGVSNLAADIRFGNLSFWGYIEVEITGTYSNQNSAGKLTKLFAVGTNPGNNIYNNVSRVADVMGTICDNIAIGDFAWDATNSTYCIPISHIVSTGNDYTIKVRMFTHSGGAGFVFPGIAMSANYTLTALPALTAATYNSNLLINGTSQVLSAGNYNSYAPTLTGTGASGTWGISITGNAATATNVTGTVAVSNGGTGLTSIAARSIPVANSADTYTTVTPAAGQSVRVNAGNTAWEAYTPGTGTVTGVTATAPVASSGGTAPVISMAAASASANGYLTSTDWSTFNGKGSGTVTSVTATAPVASTGGTTPVISMGAASSGVNGYMTGTYATKLDGIAAGATNVTNTNQLTNGAGFITSAGNAATATTATNVSGGTVSSTRINPRTSTTTSTASISPDIASFDQYAVTAQAAGLTINAPTGTPVDGNKLMFRLLDNGTARAITWNGTYTAIGATLPTTTVASKTTYVGCIYNANNTRWDVIAVTTQA